MEFGGRSLPLASTKTAAHMPDLAIAAGAATTFVAGIWGTSDGASSRSFAPQLLRYCIIEAIIVWKVSYCGRK